MKKDVQYLPRFDAGVRISGKAHPCSRPWMSIKWDQVSLWDRQAQNLLIHWTKLQYEAKVVCHWERDKIPYPPQSQAKDGSLGWERSTKPRYPNTLLTLRNVPCVVRRRAEILLMPGSSNDTKQKSAATEKEVATPLYPRPPTDISQSLPTMMEMSRKLAWILQQHYPVGLSTKTKISYIYAVQYTNH